MAIFTKCLLYYHYVEYTAYSPWFTAPLNSSAKEALSFYPLLRKPRPRGVQLFASSHMTNRWQTQDSNPVLMVVSGIVVLPLCSNSPLCIWQTEHDFWPRKDGIQNKRLFSPDSAVRPLLLTLGTKDPVSARRKGREPAGSQQVAGSLPSCFQEGSFTRTEKQTEKIQPIISLQSSWPGFTV